MDLFKKKSKYLEDLRSPDPAIRARAAQELSNLEERRALEPLIELLKNDPDRRVRWRAAYALGEFGEIGVDRAFEILVENLNHEEDWNVRRIIVMALRHWDDRAMDPLLRSLDDENEYVRRYASMTLGFKKSKEALPKLEKMASEDPSKDVRDNARWAVSKIKKKWLL